MKLPGGLPRVVCRLAYTSVNQAQKAQRLDTIPSISRGSAGA
jgi:hypothetical protein